MSLERWLGHLQPRTNKVCRWIFSDFLEWLKDCKCKFRGYGPDELVDWQRHNQGSYELLDVVEDYVRQKEGTYEYKKKIYGSIRSFFAHNRCELPRDTGFKVNATRKAVVGRLSVDEFRRVLASCNSLYRAVFLVMFMGGMGVGELLEFDATGYESLQQQFDNRVSPIRVELPGRKKLKNVKPYYTYLGSDAVAALRVWLKERPREAGKRVFCTQFQQPLGYNAIQMYWLKKMGDLGIIDRRRNGDPGNRYGKNLHELRDLYKTRWRISGVDIEVGDYFMGHDIDGLGYDKSPRDYPEWYRDCYLRAEPWLNVLSADPEKVPRTEVDRLKREQDEARRDFEKELLERVRLMISESK